MTLLSKYIIKNTIKTFLFTILIFLLLGMLTRLTYYLSIITESNGAVWDLITILFLIQFKVIITLTPFALLIVAFIIFDSIIKSNEHIACYSVGISQKLLILPFLKVLGVVFLINLFLSSIVVPFAYNKINNINHRLISNVSNSLIKSGEFISQKGVTIFFNEIQNNNVANGITIIDKRQKGTKLITIANTGVVGFDGSFISFEAGNAYFNYQSKDFKYPIVSKFNDFILFLKTNNNISSDIQLDATVSNTQLIKKLIEGDKSKIVTFIARFGWPFFSILMPLSVAVCLLKFFGFTRRRISFQNLLQSIIIIVYTIFSAFFIEYVLPKNFIGLFLYYLNIFLIFSFLYFRLER